MSGLSILAFVAAFCLVFLFLWCRRGRSPPPTSPRSPKTGPLSVDSPLPLAESTPAPPSAPTIVGELRIQLPAAETPAEPLAPASMSDVNEPHASGAPTPASANTPPTLTTVVLTTPSPNSPSRPTLTGIQDFKLAVYQLCKASGFEEYTFTQDEILAQMTLNRVELPITMRLMKLDKFLRCAFQLEHAHHVVLLIHADSCDIYVPPVTMKSLATSVAGIIQGDMMTFARGSLHTKVLPTKPAMSNAEMMLELGRRREQVANLRGVGPSHSLSHIPVSSSAGSSTPAPNAETSDLASEHQATVARLEADKEKLLAERDALRVRLKEKQNLLEGSRAYVRDLKEQLRREEEERAALAETNVELGGANAALGQANAALGQSNAALGQSNAALGDALRAAQAEVREREREVKEINERLESLKRSVISAAEVRLAPFLAQLWLTDGLYRLLSDYPSHWDR
ncbi:hypothetical protein FA95DRAFT_1603096 [Auriscalpium vulgare]|uniref:Uncharacterized protein n=1 Tax=Auriscalpium vulgare TaxID=40419 RepID=A0ACB8S4N8_9AGAM|nr:hypothetical protein FA95DRAFT_1603096 [Auriscalpium vulgare]